MAEKGWGMYATGSVPAPKQEGYWDIVLKVRDASAEDIVAAIEQIEGSEVTDVREM
jgi:hypothetical protein